MKLVLALVAGLFAIVGNVPYLRAVILRKIEPHPYTWLVWSIVSGITLSGQLVKGAGVGALPVVIAEGFTVVIFLFALRNGFKHIVKTDTYFLLAALLGLIPWILTSDPTISVAIVVAIDVIAFFPTLRKAWRSPKTETPILYLMNVLRHILILFSLEAYNVATVLHSIAMIATNTVMTSFLLARRRAPHA